MSRHSSSFDPRSFANGNIRGLSPATTPELSQGAYVASVGLFILLGYSAAAVAIWIVGRFSGWALPVTGLVLSWVGLELASRTASWTTSLLGHLVASFGVGFFLGPLFYFDRLLWLRTAGLTVFIGTAFLTALGALLPGLLRAFGAFVLGSGFASGLLWLTGPMLLSGLAAPLPTLASTISAVCALAFTDRYWSRALALPPTLNNAVDSACAIYVDPLNSLLSLLDRQASRRLPRRR